MSIADKIRSRCVERYVAPALRGGQVIFEVIAGDLHKDLDFRNRLPAVCSALGADIFCEENNLMRINVLGPLTGSKTKFIFAFKDRSNRTTLCEKCPAKA